MGEMEIVYELKMDHGKITGAQKLPFGDAPIVDSKIKGNEFELTVELDLFGAKQRDVAKGKIVGDTLEIVPALPGPPPGMPGQAPGVPSGGRTPAMMSAPVVFRRGRPAPSYRAPSVDYRRLEKVPLPEIHDLSNNGLARTPPMGWNSWNKFHTKIDDKTIRQISDAIVTSGMKDAGYEYVNIDDGWQGRRDGRGVLHPNPHFPDMKSLADYIHSKGLKLGIYSSPGPRTCGGFEGSYGHEKTDAETWAIWGIDYLKYDWCSASRIWRDEDMRAVYQRMGEALQKSGRPIVFSLCQYGRAKVEEWGPKVGGHLWRTTGDISDNWDSMRRIGFAQSDLARYAGPRHWNDPDMLEVGNGRMSLDEYRTHFSLWAMLAAPLIAGNDLRHMSPGVRELLINMEVIAVDQDRLGKAGYLISRNGECEVWAKPLQGGAYAVALFNLGSKTAPLSVAWSDLKIAGRPRIRDLWAHSDRASTTDRYSAAVPPHGTVMIRVAPSISEPCIRKALLPTTPGRKRVC